MRHLCIKTDDVIPFVVTYLVTCSIFPFISTWETSSMEDNLQTTNTFPSARPSGPLTSKPEEEMTCCDGVLGYSSDNESINFPCHDLPCCNSSETPAVVSIDHALGFRFQCMPRSNIKTLCYQFGAEVRTSNQDPDFIPRACCPGLKFKVLINQWYAATVVKCVKMEEEKS